MITKEKVYIPNHYTQRGGGDNQLNFLQVLDGKGLWLVGGQTPLHRGGRGVWVVKLVPRTDINTTRNKSGKRGGD